MSDEPTHTKHDPFPRRFMVYYSLPHLTHAVVLLPMALFIPSFYSDDLALPLASVGIAIAASRLLDVFTDPVIGILSDRFRMRWGTRKPWLIAGTPLLMLSSWMIFVPDEKISLSYLLIWTSILFFAYTLVDSALQGMGRRTFHRVFREIPDHRLARRVRRCRTSVFLCDTYNDGLVWL